MSGSKRSPSSTAARAARLLELLSAADPEQAEQRARSAAQHFERERRPRSSARQRGAGASSPQGEAGARAEREYLHRGPTRSAVLNAFLSELGGRTIVPVNATVYNEHTLAPRLVELARQRLPSMLLASGKTEAGLLLAGRLKPIENERAARLFLRQAAQQGSDLGAIARDYEAARGRAGAPEQDDLHASCIMAAFAGRMIALAERLLGPHVRDEVRDELSQWTSEGSAAARRRRVSAPLAPGGAESPGDATSEREAAGALRRRRRS